MKALETAAIFKDNMVLQQNKEINLWGKSEPLKKITITISDITCDTLADKNGEWKLSFPPLKAGGPYEVVITDQTDKLIYKNVMIGEVWFAGGQSNMQFELCRCSSYSQTEKRLGTGKSDIRFYLTAKQSYFCEEFESKEQNVKWLTENDDGYGCISAVAYYAAEQLSASFPGTAIGIICCYWGGTSASTWIDRDTLGKYEVLSEYIKDYEIATAGQTDEEYKQKFNEFLEFNRIWYSKYNKLIENKPDMSWDEAISILGPDRWCPPIGPYSQCAPGVLFNTMFMRVCPYTVKGIWFYQGESDDHKPDIYSVLLTALIKKWRECWNDHDLPFIFVQLPMFTEEGRKDVKSWAIIREEQQKVFQDVKNTGMVISVDQGEYNNIHPITKIHIGERLGKQSLRYAYNIGNDKDIYEPVFSGFTTEGNSVKVSFKYADNSLCIHGDKITGFELAGSDRNFKPADAQIEGSDIIVRCNDIIDPVYIRYLFTDYSEVTLFGRNGIPAAPFRTDRL